MLPDNGSGSLLGRCLAVWKSFCPLVAVCVFLAVLSSVCPSVYFCLSVCQEDPVYAEGPQECLLGALLVLVVLQGDLERE